MYECILDSNVLGYDLACIIAEVSRNCHLSEKGEHFFFVMLEK